MRTILALLAVGLAAALLFWFTLRPEQIESGTDVEQGQQMPVAPAPPLQGPSTVREELIVVRLVDEISKELIPLDVGSFTLKWPSSELVRLEPQTRLPKNRLLGGDFTICYEVPGVETPRAMETSPRGRALFQEQDVLITIPFYSEIEVEMHPPASPIGIPRLSAPIMLPVSQGSLEAIGKREGWPLFSTNSQRGLVLKAISVLTTESFSEVDGQYLWRGLHAGDCLISTWSEETGISFSFIETVPGQRTHAKLSPEPRPMVRGKVYDWNHIPVPGVTVRVATVLNDDQFDFSSDDSAAGASLMVGGPEGHYTRTTRRHTESLEDGSFQLFVPRGGAFAAEARQGDAYAFVARNTAMLSAADSWEVDLILMEPLPENGLTLEVLDDRGEPFTGALVGISIADDFPFFRQFPQKVPVNDAGTVFYLGIPLGVQIGVFVRHPDLVKAYFPPLVLVNEKRIQIRVPGDAFKPSAELDEASPRKVRD